MGGESTDSGENKPDKRVFCERRYIATGDPNHILGKTMTKYDKDKGMVVLYATCEWCGQSVRKEKRKVGKTTSGRRPKYRTL